VGSKWQQGRLGKGRLGLYIAPWARSRVVFHRTRLGGVGGGLGRHGGLVPVILSAVSVVAWFGQNGRRFSAGAV
jgi:hypothetical protein